MSSFYSLRLIFLQLSMIGVCFSINAREEVYTQYGWSEPKIVHQIDVNIGRSPASSIPRDDIQPAPNNRSDWVEDIFVEDDAGILSNVSGQITSWQQTENYREQWDIDSTGLYQTPDQEAKKLWLNRMLLRYIDKRISGEMKNASDGSTLKTIATAQQALRPSTQATITEKVKLKFKARILQLQATVKIINPWLQAETYVDAEGSISTNLSRNIASLGVNANLQYQVDQGSWTASVSRPITSNVTAVISSSQTDRDLVFSTNSDSRIQLLYFQPF